MARTLKKKIKPKKRGGGKPKRKTLKKQQRGGSLALIAGGVAAISAAAASAFAGYKYMNMIKERSKIKILLSQVGDIEYLPRYSVIASSSNKSLIKQYLKCVSNSEFIDILRSNPDILKTVTIQNVLTTISSIDPELIAIREMLKRNDPDFKEQLTINTSLLEYNSSDNLLSELKLYLLATAKVSKSPSTDYDEDMKLAKSRVNWVNIIYEGGINFDPIFDSEVEKILRERGSDLFVDTSIKEMLSEMKDNYYLNECINRKMEECTRKPRGYLDYIRNNITWDSSKKCLSCPQEDCLIYIYDYYYSFLKQKDSISVLQKIYILMLCEARICVLSKCIVLEALRQQSGDKSNVVRILKEIYRRDKREIKVSAVIPEKFVDFTTDKKPTVESEQIDLSGIHKDEISAEDIFKETDISLKPELESETETDEDDILKRLSSDKSFDDDLTYEEESEYGDIKQYGGAEPNPIIVPEDPAAAAAAAVAAAAAGAAAPEGGAPEGAVPAVAPEGAVPAVAPEGAPEGAVPAGAVPAGADQAADPNPIIKPEADPAAADPATPGDAPAVTDPALAVADPAVTDPAAPAVTDPALAVADPAVTDPAVTDRVAPAVTDLAAADLAAPAAADLAGADLAGADAPAGADLAGADVLAVTDAPVTYPAVTDPAVTYPAVTDPAVTDPAVTDPAVTDPAQGDTQPLFGEGTVTEVMDTQDKTIDNVNELVAFLSSDLGLYMTVIDDNKKLELKTTFTDMLEDKNSGGMKFKDSLEGIIDKSSLEGDEKTIEQLMKSLFPLLTTVIVSNQKYIDNPDLNQSFNLFYELYCHYPELLSFISPWTIGKFYFGLGESRDDKKIFDYDLQNMITVATQIQQISNGTPVVKLLAYCFLGSRDNLHTFVEKVEGKCHLNKINFTYLLENDVLLSELISELVHIYSIKSNPEIDKMLKELFETDPKNKLLGYFAENRLFMKKVSENKELYALFTKMKISGDIDDKKRVEMKKILTQSGRVTCDRETRRLMNLVNKEEEFQFGKQQALLLEFCSKAMSNLEKLMDE